MRGGAGVIGGRLGGWFYDSKSKAAIAW